MLIQREADKGIGGNTEVFRCVSDFQEVAKLVHDRLEANKWLPQLAKPYQGLLRLPICQTMSACRGTYCSELAADPDDDDTDDDPDDEL